MEEISSQNSDLGLEDLDKLEAKGQAENTKRATSWGIKKFEKWCDKRKLKVDFNCVTPVELNELLSWFSNSLFNQHLHDDLTWLWIRYSLSLYYQNSHSWYHLALFIDNMIMTWLFSGILCICTLVMSFAALALRARAANDTTRAQINNIPSKKSCYSLIGSIGIIL